MRKNELRLKMREKRRLLSPENIALMSSNIAHRLIETEEFKNARIRYGIHIGIPRGRNRRYNLRAF